MGGGQLTAGASRPAVDQAPQPDTAQAPQQGAAQAPPPGVARLDEIRASLAKEKSTGDSAAG
jgi:hypothetical protein